MGLEVAFFFTIFHGGLAALVISAGAALGLAGGGDFCDDVIESGGGAFYSAGAGDVSHGAEADGFFYDGFIRLGVGEAGLGVEP